MEKIVIASKNKGKIKEINVLMKRFNIKVIPMDEIKNIPEIIENGQSFLENAIIKAKAFKNHTGLPVIADDSGLEVEILSGKPGIYSARFAGENATDKENNKRLLELLKNIPFEKRKARFISSIALCLEDNKCITSEGICEGYITYEERGNNGFGYDPLFWVKEYEKTFGEINNEQKNRISHRSKALKKLEELLKSYFCC